MTGTDRRVVSNVRERMVDAIAGIIKTNGTCHPHNLKDQSFTPDQIARHWPSAYALACVSLDFVPKD